ncbi:MAG: DNA polymerase III subunit [Eubacterium sp.]|nr:DNA polymerase III subunit [Eubacterium sp.]
MKLTNFIGNEKVIDRLSKLLESGRFPHALIIEGEEGIGKKTLARDLACALVCRGEDKPCGECSQCKKAMSGIHPDISEYIPSGTANSFHVDTVRNIINDAYVQPNEADYKVYILANAHCMNPNAQNALLKILEEPPKYVVFILTTESKSALLSTVLSRSVCVSLEGVDIGRAANYITSHCEGVDYNTAKKTAETFNGNIGKAISSLQDSKTSELVDVCNKICKALASSNEYEMLTLCSAFQKDRQGVVFACDLLKNIFRDALFAGDVSEHISGQEESAALLKSSLSRQSLVKLMSTCDELKSMALSNANNALLITKFCYSLNRAIGR